MRKFRHACAAFFLSIVIAAGFSIYTCNVIEKMKSYADTLPNAAPDSLNSSIPDAVEYWDKNKLLLSITVSHRELDDIEEALAAVTTALENSGEDSAYSTAISNLKERLARLLESEWLSLEGIL